MGAKDRLTADAFTCEQQGRRRQQAHLRGIPGAAEVDTRERRMVRDLVRRIGIRDLPEDFAAIQIDCRDGPVGRLDYRQAVDEKREIRRHQVEVDTGRIRRRNERLDVGTVDRRYEQHAGFRVHGAALPVSAAD